MPMYSMFRCGYLNSTLNPILYPLCNKNFKIAFKRMLRGSSNIERGLVNKNPYPLINNRKTRKFNDI